MLARLQISWVTELFPGQEWEESARSGRWLQLLFWLPSEAFQTKSQHFLTVGRAALNLVLRAEVLLFKYGSWVYFSLLRKPFLGFGGWRVCHGTLGVTFKLLLIHLYEWILLIFDFWLCLPPGAAPRFWALVVNFVIVLWGGKVYPLKGREMIGYCPGGICLSFPRLHS